MITYRFPTYLVTTDDVNLTDYIEKYEELPQELIELVVEEPLDTTNIIEE